METQALLDISLSFTLACCMWIFFLILFDICQTSAVWIGAILHFWKILAVSFQMLFCRIFCGIGEYAALQSQYRELQAVEVEVESYIEGEGKGHS